MVVGLVKLYCQYSFKEGNMLQGLADLLVFIIIVIIIIFNLSFWFAMIWVGFPFLFEEERGYDFGG